MIPFVFIIDEWDIIMRKTKQNEQEQEDYLSFLRIFLNDKSYVALAYMTGILPIKKYGEQSALNSFHEYSMEDAYPFSEFTGFTEEETEMLCQQYEIDNNETKSGTMDIMSMILQYITHARLLKFAEEKGLQITGLRLKPIMR